MTAAVKKSTKPKCAPQFICKLPSRLDERLARGPDAKIRACILEHNANEVAFIKFLKTVFNPAEYKYLQHPTDKVAARKFALVKKGETEFVQHSSDIINKICRMRAKTGDGVMAKILFYRCDAESGGDLPELEASYLRDIRAL